MKSIFFWSEEHAKAYRRQVGGEWGIYLTLAQSAYVTRVAQSSLFGFPRE